MACRSRASGLGATDLAATRCEILGEDLNAEDSRSMVGPNAEKPAPNPEARGLTVCGLETARDQGTIPTGPECPLHSFSGNLLLGATRNSKCNQPSPSLRRRGTCAGGLVETPATITMEYGMFQDRVWSNSSPRKRTNAKSPPPNSS